MKILVAVKRVVDAKIKVRPLPDHSERTVPASGYNRNVALLLGAAFRFLNSHEGAASDAGLSF